MNTIYSKVKKYLPVGLTLVILLVAFNAHAVSDGSSGKLDNPLNGVNSIPDFLKAAILAVTEIGTIVGALAIMYGGFLYATAQGDEEKIGKAKSTLTWAIVGTALLIGAHAIIDAVIATVQQVVS